MGITGGFKIAPFLQFFEVLWSEIASGIYLPYSQKNTVPTLVVSLDYLSQNGSFAKTISLIKRG